MKKLFLSTLFPIRLRYWWEERRLNWEYPEKIKKAQAEGDKTKSDKLKHEYHWHLAEIRDSRLSWSQQKLIRKAHRRGIPVPRPDEAKIFDEGEEEEDENWKWSRAAAELLLKQQPTLELRREVRREIKEQRELHLPWITAWTGLFGALAGVLALLLAWFGR